MQNLSEAVQKLVEIALGVDVLEMVIQIVATILLILVVKYFFWDKVTTFIDERKAIMDKELTEATEKNEEAKMLKKEAEETFNEMKQEARDILEDAKSRGEDTRRDIISKAKDEASTIKKNAQKDLEQDIESARQALRDEIVDIASLLAEKVIAKEIDEKTYNTLIDNAIKEAQKQ